MSEQQTPDDDDQLIPDIFSERVPLYDEDGEEDGHADVWTEGEEQPETP